MFYNGKVSSSTLLPTLQLARKATLAFPRNARRRPRDPHQLVLVRDTEVGEDECARLITIDDRISWTGVHHEWISGDVHVVDERRKDSDVGHHILPCRGPYDQAANLSFGIHVTLIRRKHFLHTFRAENVSPRGISHQRMVHFYTQGVVHVPPPAPPHRRGGCDTGGVSP